MDQDEYEHDALRGINGRLEYRVGEPGPSTQDLVTGYTEYRTQVHEQEAIIAAGDVLAYLCCAFMSMPSIESVEITDEWVGDCSATSSSELPNQKFEYRKLQDQRQQKKLLYPASPFHVGSGDSDEAKERAFRSLRMRIHSLCITNHRIGELSITALNPEYSLLIDVFNMHPTDFQRMNSVFQHLRYLDLKLHTCEGYAMMDDYFTQGIVAKALGTAQNLRHLSISLDSEYTISLPCTGFSSFHGILGGCYYPNLDTLKLTSFTLSEAELISLLGRHSHSLRHLDLQDTYMFSGYWEGTLNRARQLLHLTLVGISGVAGGFRPPYEGAHWTNHGEIESFFLCSGPNPFTPQALDALHSDRHGAIPQQCRRNQYGRFSTFTLSP